MVSKAADKNSKISIAPLPLPIVATISLYTLNKTVSHCDLLYKQTENYQQYHYLSDHYVFE